jgi:hypothetical protein
LAPVVKKTFLFVIPGPVKQVRVTCLIFESICRAYPREAPIAACDANDLTDKYEIRLKNVLGKNAPAYICVESDEKDL